MLKGMPSTVALNKRSLNCQLLFETHATCTAAAVVRLLSSVLLVMIHVCPLLALTSMVFNCMAVFSASFREYSSMCSMTGPSSKATHSLCVSLQGMGAIELLLTSAQGFDVLDGVRLAAWCLDGAFPRWVALPVPRTCPAVYCVDFMVCKCANISFAELFVCM